MSDLKVRKLDTISYRVKRNGKYHARCFTDLLPSEQEQLLEEHNKKGLDSIIKCLTSNIIDISYNCLSEDEMREVAKDIAGLLRGIGDKYDINNEICGQGFYMRYM